MLHSCDIADCLRLIYNNYSYMETCVQLAAAQSVLKTETSIMYTQRTHQESGPHGCSNVTGVVDVSGEILVLISVYKTKYYQQQPNNQMKA